MQFNFDLVGKYQSRKDFEQACNISLKNNYVFIIPSKCASSTIKTYLQKKEFENSCFDIVSVDDKRVSPLLSPYQLGEDYFLNMLADPSIKKITFSRNPYTRLLANYICKLVRSKKSHPAREFRRKSKIKGDVSFADFIRFVCTQNSYDMNSHWRPVSEAVLFDNIAYDYVGRVEDLRTDLIAIGKLLFGDSYTIENVFNSDGYPLILDKVGNIVSIDDPMSVSQDKTSLHAEVEEYYTPELIHLINKRYRCDFDNFNYQML